MINPSDSIPPRPISILEQKPGQYDPDLIGLQDCDSQGRCWYFRRNYGEWHYRRLTTGQYMWWLPHWALPFPQKETS